MSTLVAVIDQSDTTDTFGQVYVSYSAHIDHAIGCITGTGATRVASYCHVWVSGDKQATVKVWKADGTVLASHSVQVAVAAWSG